MKVTVIIEKEARKNKKKQTGKIVMMERSLNSIKTSIKWNKQSGRGLIIWVLIFCFISATFVSCIKLKGEFALRYPMDDVFRRVSGKVEINSNDRVEWMFKFQNVPAEKRKIGIFIMKKELIWVDVYDRVEEIGMGSSAVLGTIKGYSEGSYQLILTDARNNSKIDTLDFMVYADED